MRLWVFAEQGGMCAVVGCDQLASELDHITGKARGGTDQCSNLQGLCADHHREKTQAESRAARGL